MIYLKKWEIFAMRKQTNNFQLEALKIICKYVQYVLVELFLKNGWLEQRILLTQYIHKAEQTQLNPACSQTAQWWTRKRHNRHGIRTNAQTSLNSPKVTVCKTEMFRSTQGNLLFLTVCPPSSSSSSCKPGHKIPVKRNEV